MEPRIIKLAFEGAAAAVAAAAARTLKAAMTTEVWLFASRKSRKNSSFFKISPKNRL